MLPDVAVRVDCMSVVQAVVAVPRSVVPQLVVKVSDTAKPVVAVAVALPV